MGEEDRENVLRIETEPGKSEGIARLVPFDQLSADEQEAYLRYVEGLEHPETLTSHQKLAWELNRRPHPEVAFVRPGIIKPPALALAVRDPAAKISRLIVLEETATDWTYSLARRAFIGTEMIDALKGEPEARTVLSILPDGTAVDEHGTERLPAFTAEPPEHAKTKQNRDVQLLLQHSKEEAQIAGLGPGRVVQT